LVQLSATGRQKLGRAVWKIAGSRTDSHLAPSAGRAPVRTGPKRRSCDLAVPPTRRSNPRCTPDQHKPTNRGVSPIAAERQLTLRENPEDSSLSNGPGTAGADDQQLRLRPRVDLSSHQGHVRIWIVPHPIGMPPPSVRVYDATAPLFRRSTNRQSKLLATQGLGSPASTREWESASWEFQLAPMGCMIAHSGEMSLPLLVNQGSPHQVRSLCCVIGPSEFHFSFG
jgi:hypothetical protein